MNRRLVWLLLLLVPMAQGANEDVVDATLTVRTQLPYAALEEFIPVSTAQEDALAPRCGGPLAPESYFKQPADGRGFIFEENDEERGCAQARFTIDASDAGETMVVQFKAAKRVAQPTGESIVPGLAVEVKTQLLFFDMNGDALDILPDDFMKSDSIREDTDMLNREFSLDAFPDHFILAFYFEDVGPSVRQEIPGPLFGQKVSVSIIDPAVLFPGTSVLGPVRTHQADTTGGEVQRHITVTADVDDEHVAGVDSLTFEVLSRITPVHVRIPDGRILDRSAYTIGGDGVFTQVIVPGAVVKEFGAGTYEARFASTSTLEPTPVLVPFIAAIMVAPVIAGVYASRAARRFSGEAVGVFLSTARALRATLGFWWSIYAGLILYILVARLWNLIFSWPIQSGAAFIHGGFVMVTVGFFLSGVYWHRNLSTAMEEDLTEKERMNEELHRSNTELQQFAYVASHDLQEPLRTISRFTQLLQRRYGDKLDEDAREFMDFTVDGAKRMQGLIDDLLAFSRVDSKARDPVPVDLNGILERVTTALHARIEDTGAVVEYDELPTIHGDGAQMGQLFQNLLSNAMKFKHAKRKPKVSITATQANGRWHIRVQDNGIGIDKKYLERIFVVFQRLHTREEISGTGIGLAICKKIVERHGGTIRVESKVGTGTTFIFDLPAV